jgi:hypothetical protein
MPVLLPDPTAAVQTARPPGPWILWEPARASARREGLLCTPRACDNPKCRSVGVLLDVHPIDTGLASVEWEGDTLKLTWSAPATPERARAVLCHLDLYRAEVKTEERSAYADELKERVRKLAGAELLDRLHDQLCMIRGYPRGTSNRLPEYWEPGDLIDWIDAQNTPRLDVVEAGGRTWLAIDQHCPQPDCDCPDTQIAFQKFDVVERSATDLLGLVVVYPDGKWDLRPRTKEGLVLRDAWQVLSERWGDVPRELARRREALRSALGSLVLEAGQGGRHRARPAERAPANTGLVGASPAAPGPRRNDPCPCGSGRKYKRCCGLGA